MNSGIRELAEQARYDSRNEKHYLERVHNREITLDEYQEIYDKKFAELLLKECIAECRSNDLDVDRYSDEYDFGVKFGVDECVRGIKTRFGVEE